MSEVVKPRLSICCSVDEELLFPSETAKQAEHDAAASILLSGLSFMMSAADSLLNRRLES